MRKNTASTAKPATSARSVARRQSVAGGATPAMQEAFRAFLTGTKPAKPARKPARTVREERARDAAAAVGKRVESEAAAERRALRARLAEGERATRHLRPARPVVVKCTDCDEPIRDHQVSPVARLCLGCFRDAQEAKRSKGDPAWLAERTADRWHRTEQARTVGYHVARHGGRGGVICAGCALTPDRWPAGVRGTLKIVRAITADRVQGEANCLVCGSWVNAQSPAASPRQVTTAVQARAL